MSDLDKFQATVIKTMAIVFLSCVISITFVATVALMQVGLKLACEVNK